MRSLVTRQSVQDTLQERPNTFYWDFKVISWPAAVYYPGDVYWQTRLVSCTPPAGTTDITLHDTNQLGHNVLQIGEVKRNGDLQMSFVDYNDQNIQAIFYDWRDKMQSANIKLGLPKATLVMTEAELYQCNRQGINLKKWTLRNGLLRNFSTGETFTSDNADQPLLTATIAFEFVQEEILTHSSSGLGQILKYL
jgi:hypothetical protein